MQMRFRSFRFLDASVTLLIALGTTYTATATDWPTWGGNAARTAVATSELPEDLHLCWVLKLREPDPAWHSNQERVQFDRMYEPVVVGQRMFVGSMVGDRVSAYHTESGEELWRFDTDGPVRLAPTVWEENVYFACDDGHLYCVNAADGSLVWKFYGGPLDRRILGNDRLISIFPARGAAVVYDGTVYFAAGIWPFMGTFIHALDPETGAVIWTNSGTGSMYILQQHDRPAFAGIAPQGYLVATEEILLVSGGQTVPAAFNRHTGEFVHFNVNTREMGEKGGSGYHVRATDDFFVTNEYMFRMSDGAYLARIDYPIITEQSLVSIDPSGTLRAYQHDMHIEKTNDRKGRDTVKATLKERWNAELGQKLERLHLMAGSRAVATGTDGLVAAVELSEQYGDPRITWTTRVEGDPLSVIAADEKLFVSTDRGSIYCFAGIPPADGQPVIVDESGAGSSQIITARDEWQQHVQALLSETGATAGHCLLLGIGSGRLLDELLLQSDLHVIALDPDMNKVSHHRQRLDAAGLYGQRAEVFAGDVFSMQLPPYIAQLIVSEDAAAAGIDRGEEFVSRIFGKLRPYGGVACLPVAKEQATPFDQFASDGNPHNALLKRSANGSHLLLSRESSLPGSAPWTHQYSDAGNSVMSQDGLVKAPLGMLWFGGPSNEKVLPRHGHGPTPQVAGGRLFIEGRDMLRAVDVYTGRLLWERDFPDVGQYYDYTSHEPGANAIGSNYVSLEDSVYIIHEDTCYRLDARTGATACEFNAPAATGEEGAPEWGHLSVVGDTLIGGVQPVHFSTYLFNFRELRKHDGDRGRAVMAEIRKWKNFDVHEPQRDQSLPFALIENLNHLLFSADFLAKIPGDVRRRAADARLERELQDYLAGGEGRDHEPRAIELKRRLLEQYYELPIYEDRTIGMYGNWSRRSSRRLVGLDRITGEVRWSVPARYAFRHNAIAAGNGMVFAIDRLQDAEVEKKRRRGIPVDDNRRIIAVDLGTGEERWSVEDGIFGTWLGYSCEYDVLIQAGSAAGDRALDEASAGIVAYWGADGTVLWESDSQYSGPLMLHHDTIYSQPGPGRAFHLLTGEMTKRPHPLSGEMVEWTYSRDGGCNTAICSQHMITFRSSAAGYFDLLGNSGTGNWGGFRSSCTSNLIPADGVLNAPDYTRTCTCTFQNRSSLALVHMPEIETWTFNRFDWDGRRVRQLGLNFGAPGDRRSPSGLLWLDFPSVGGDSPDVPVTVEGDEVEYLRYHSSHIRGEGLGWVASCGVTGASAITITLDKDKTAPPQDYTVRLHFAEIGDQQPGERVFDVALQNELVLIDFDVHREAGASNRDVVKEFCGISAGNSLRIELIPKSGRTFMCGVELMAEEW